MRVFPVENVLMPTAIALGNFDGLHLGHQQVISPILASRVSGCQPLGYPTLVTFDPHPQEFFSGEAKKLLTPQAEKVQHLERMGVKQLVLLPFDQELASLTPEQFIQEIIVKQLQAKLISVGEDFRFGHERMGTAAVLKAIAITYGINVIIVPLFTINHQRVSSSVIREALQQGNINLVNQLLGRHYRLCGPVVMGAQLGRTLGFPTANLQLPVDKFLPKHGVYAVQVSILGNDNQYLQQDILGVMNLGCRPTVAGSQPTTEVHLLDWSGDLYGHNLEVNLKEFVRCEQKFSSLDALKEQIAQDCLVARKIR